MGAVAFWFYDRYTEDSIPQQLEEQMMETQIKEAELQAMEFQHRAAVDVIAEQGLEFEYMETMREMVEDVDGAMVMEVDADEDPEDVIQEARESMEAEDGL